jgi:hypothetical protein
MRSLVLASIAVLSAAASSSIDHMGDVYSLSGSGSWYLSLPKDDRNLEQYLNYHYNYTNATVFNQTTEIVPGDDFHMDTIQVAYSWFANAGYSGTYTSAPEMMNSNIWNFKYLLSFFANGKLRFDITLFQFYKASAVLLLDFIDGAAVQEFRWIRPMSLMKGAVS